MGLKKLLWLCCLLPLSCFAQKTLNLYVWGGEIPLSLIKKFEDETHIEVNFSTFDSNEALYAKLKTNNDYDVVLPSSYLVGKLIKNDFLKPIDKSKLPNIKNISPAFLGMNFDRTNSYAIPFTWGATGIFHNKLYSGRPQHWQELWQVKFKDRLLMIDDAREVFAIALLSLGYSPNDTEPKHLKEAYEKLIKIQPNIKLLSSNTIQGLIVDEEATLGFAWNGDIFKVLGENKNIDFFLPEEGFAMWIDCLAILKNAPHPVEAHQFINFMLDGKNAAKAIISESMSSPNLAAKQYLPKKILESKIMYPDPDTIRKGTVLADLGPKATKIMLEYWQKFKLSF